MVRFASRTAQHIMRTFKTNRQFLEYKMNKEYNIINEWL
ncbi:hypothetical protein P278_31280 [Zhouia amylolytica AD3]|uniref:Uncharacterized protein n=1 Tax=Zhouia amylolytica AD3 TaxID=1286632 RepID=W2UKM2_9FLAO|nr:hypothetical protein P278_31280 [Zhouia amylolytica AD3]